MPKGLVRYQHCGVFHFVTFSCYHRQPLLAAAKSRDLFEQVLDQVRRRYAFVVVGYVVMPEHVHLLVNEPRYASLPIALQVLKQRTSRLLKPEGAPAFWQQRYYDFNVETEAKTQEKLHYMHGNPVRRGLADQPEHWKWSSFRHCATGFEGVVEIESQWTAQRREQQTGRPDWVPGLPPLPR